MEALHQAGGVPPGWRFSVPAGSVPRGKAAFVALGCHRCHAIAGEGLPSLEAAERGPGPELTGMGLHHPPEYFVESILTPDAVLVDGPGHAGADGLSTMPRYPEMTADQLVDLVAYLGSLTGGGSEHAHHGAAGVAAPFADVPPAPSGRGSIFQVMVYDVAPGKLDAFLDWFRTEAAPQLRKADGLQSVETFVDTTRTGPQMLTVFSFRDDAAFSRFLGDPGTADVKRRFDGFIGPHPHLTFRGAPVYRVDALSLQ